MLILPNVTMELSNVRKNKCTTEYARIQSYVMSVLSNVIMEPSNTRKKNKGTIECDKSMATCDVGTA